MKLRSIAALWFAILAAPAQAAGDAARGEELYDARCTGCHSLDANRVGPLHRGVVGRKAGSIRDFAYSPALRKATITWSEPMLDRWLANPEALVPGQKMGYSVTDAVDRADIIAYLRRETVTP